MAERSKDSIRLGIQDYLQKATGHKATITDMVSVELSPNMAFLMKGIILQDINDDKKVFLKIEEANIAKPFLSVLTGRQNYLSLSTKGVEIASGYVFPLKMNISFAGISDPEPSQKPAFFVVDGIYDAKNILLTLELERKATKKHYLYSVPKISPFTFKIGNVEAEGTLHKNFSDISFLDVSLRNECGQGHIDIENVGFNPVSGNLTGHINDIPVKGSLTSSGDDMSLMINPISDEKNQKIVQDFIQSIKKDLAIEKDNTKFKIQFISKQENE